MPEVISTGGVYFSDEGQFEFSDLSSRYSSAFFPGREIPDLCGLVGNRPHGRLLLVPVPPRASLARRPGFSTIAAGAGDPGSEGRRKAHGWAMFSGTSASTAMVSGAAALLLQCRPGLSPAEIKRLLVENAVRVPESGCRVLAAFAAVRSLKNEA
jgi:subtilisin family serine protease